MSDKVEVNKLLKLVIGKKLVALYGIVRHQLAIIEVNPTKGIPESLFKVIGINHMLAPFNSMSIHKLLQGVK